MYQIKRVNAKSFGRCYFSICSSIPKAKHATPWWGIFRNNKFFDFVQLFCQLKFTYCLICFVIILNNLYANIFKAKHLCLFETQHENFGRARKHVWFHIELHRSICIFAVPLKLHICSLTASKLNWKFFKPHWKMT